MKNKSLQYFIIISLIVGSVFAEIHVPDSDFGVQAVQNIDDHSQQDDTLTKTVECHQCYHTTGAIAFSQQSDYSVLSSQQYISYSSEFYLSRFETPPFQPPKS